MNILNTVLGTVNTAVDTISSAAHTVVEKNRVNAKLNRLRTIMKNESELMNRAYIALGKQYYENKQMGAEISQEKEKKLFELIESSKAKIAKARECYRKIVDSRNDIFYGATENKNYNSDDLVDITVACSNENEYDSSRLKKTKSPLRKIPKKTPATAQMPSSPLRYGSDRRRRGRTRRRTFLINAFVKASSALRFKFSG